MTPATTRSNHRSRGDMLHQRSRDSTVHSHAMIGLASYGESSPAIDIPGKRQEKEVANPQCAELMEQSLSAMEARMSSSRSRGRPGSSMHGNSLSMPHQPPASIDAASSFNPSSINFSSVNSASFHGVKGPTSPPGWRVSPAPRFGAGSLAFSYNEVSYKYRAAAAAEAAAAENRQHYKGEYDALQRIAQPTQEGAELAASAVAHSANSIRRRDDRKISPQHAEGVTRAGENSPVAPAARRDVFAEWHGENGGNFPGGSFYDPVAHDALGRRRMSEGNGEVTRASREPFEEDDEDVEEGGGDDGRGGGDDGCLFHFDDLDES